MLLWCFEPVVNFPSLEVAQVTKRYVGEGLRPEHGGRGVP